MNPALTPLDEAIEQLLNQAEPIARRLTTSLQDALNGILAEPVTAPVTVPPADNSAVDGYAVRFADLQQGVPLPLSQRIPAGLDPNPLQAGTAARIFTGASIPAGADTVIMQERCREENGQVTIDQNPEAGQNIRPAGQDFQRGDELLPAGTRLQPWHLGLLASAGLADVVIYAPLTIAVLSTGDELTAPGDPLPPGHIYNSNRDMLKALVRRAGFRVHDCGNVADTLAATREALTEAQAAADVIITTGGVSVGEEDHVRDAVTELGQLDLWRLAIKPGKPFASGRVGKRPFIGLPGNPAAVLVTFLTLVTPMLRRLQGEGGDPRLQGLPARIDFSVDKASPRRDFRRVRCHERDGALWLEPASNQSSGLLNSACWADGLAAIPEDRTLAHGDTVRFHPFNGL